MAAKKHKPDKTIWVKATPSKLHKPGLETLSPVILHPPHESVTPSLAINGITYMPCRHIGFKIGSDGSKIASSYNAIEPAQPATKEVCIRWTAINRPGSFRTTVWTRYQGNPILFYKHSFFGFLTNLLKNNIIF